MQRETQFEKNDQWKKFLVDATDQHELARLKELLSTKMVLVIKTSNTSKINAIVQSGWQQQAFGKWTLYYN